jgi:hypothetical protein
VQHARFGTLHGMTVRSGLAVALLAGGFLSGCGDDERQRGATGLPRTTLAVDWSAAPASSAPTPAWAEEANRLCRQNEELEERVLDRYMANTLAVLDDAQAMKDVSDERLRGIEPGVLVAQITATDRGFLARLRALAVPAVDRADWSTFVDRLAAAADLGHVELRRIMTAAETNDASAVDRGYVRQLRMAAARMRPSAERYGVDDCLPVPDFPAAP